MKKGLMANFNFKIFASELVPSVHVPEAVLLDDGDEGEWIIDDNMCNTW